MTTPEPILPLSLLDKNRDEFNALFYSPESIPLQAKTNLHIHVLRVKNGDYDLTGLYGALKNNSVAYVLSRLNYSKAMSDPAHMVEIVNKVQSQFKMPDDKAGEGGEIILYSLLEGHLGAPKVLSKMELKTSSQHYVHGSDGVHLLRTGEAEFQLIFGESKMYGDAGTAGASAKRGIQAAFDSVEKVHKDGFDADAWLVQSELLKEVLDDEKVAALSAILLPSMSGSGVQTVNAFGIFVGYEVDVTDIKFEDLSLTEIEQLLRDRATEAIKAEQDTIKKEIRDRGLGGYPFHIYSVPFTKREVKGEARGILQVRRELAAQLGHHENKTS